MNQSAGGGSIALAIDLGGTKASFALIEESGVVLSRSKRPSRQAGRAVSFDALASSALEAVRAAGLEWGGVRAAGVVALGATLAGIFPSVLASAGGRYPAHSGTVFGVLFTMALCGGMTLPWVTGQAALAWGLRPALALVSLQFLAVCALQAWAARWRPATGRA